MRRPWLLVISLTVCLLASISLYRLSHPPSFRLLFFQDPKKGLFTSIQIQGETYLCMLDSGANDYLSLRREILEKIPEKKLQDTASSVTTSRGRTHMSSNYVVSDVTVGNQHFPTLFIGELTEGEIADGKIYEGPLTEEDSLSLNIDGFIGIKLLERKNLLLDFSKHMILECRHPKRLAQAGYPLETFASVPFVETDNDKVIITLETNFGKLRMLLDTGTSHTSCKPNTVPESEKDVSTVGNIYVFPETCHIGSYALNPFAIYIRDSALGEGIYDGILGIDVLSKYILFLDRKTQTLYLRESP